MIYEINVAILAIEKASYNPLLAEAIKLLSQAGDRVREYLATPKHYNVYGQILVGCLPKPLSTINAEYFNEVNRKRLTADFIEYLIREFGLQKVTITETV